VDLKTTGFKPEYAGKMNFYLSAVDDLLRHPDDKLSLGLILCKTRSKIVANAGGISVPATSVKDPFKALDDPMSVVEALCPTWPQREPFVSTAEMLL
jgi:YhcG PDDEXK nuclease domain